MPTAPTPTIRRRVGSVATILTAAVLTVASAAAIGPASAAEPLIVDILVELDFTPPGGLARVFEVTGVDAGAGTWELTEADETANPQGLCGSVKVDVDPNTHRITVATEDDCNFTSAWIRITSDRIASVTAVSDGLWGPRVDEEGEFGSDMTPVEITRSGSAFELYWETVGIDEGSFLQPDGTAVFEFTLVDEEPTTTTTSEPTTTTATTTTAPPAAPPSGARPILAGPSYTG